MYHQIDVPPPRGTPLRGLVVSAGAFARQMLFLKLLGYRGLSMHDLEPYLNGERQGRVVGVTFDDGYQNNLQNALPVLKKHGFTAICYAVSSMLGGGQQLGPGNRRSAKALDDCPGLAHMAASGCSWTWMSARTPEPMPTSPH